jgi:CelD/BcsL family acetyltransferase involved in cellulose biosynthesis
VFRQSFSHLCPYLDLNQSWDSYLQSRSSKLRKNLRASRKRLESLGPTELRIFESTHDIDTGLAIVRDLHKRSWKHVKKIEHSKSDAYERFYGAWIKSQAQLGRARVLALFSGSRPVAATIALLNGTTYHSAQIVHDAEYAHCSPGTLLESLELEGLMHEQRFTTFDFMGSFLNNKLRWTNTATPTSHVFLMRKNLRNAIIDGYYFYLKPWLKPKVLRLLERRKTKP